MACALRAFPFFLIVFISALSAGDPAALVLGQSKLSLMISCGWSFGSMDGTEPSGYHDELGTLHFDLDPHLFTTRPPSISQ